MVRHCDSDLIPLHGLSLIPLEDIFETDGDSAYFIDVSGLLTSVSNEKQFERDGKLTRMIVIELDVDSAKIECSLLRHYVDEVISFLASGDFVQFLMRFLMVGLIGWLIDWLVLKAMKINSRSNFIPTFGKCLGSQAL